MKWKNKFFHENLSIDEIAEQFRKYGVFEMQINSEDSLYIRFKSLEKDFDSV